MSKYYKTRNRTWWTRERMIAGLQRFYKDFGFCAVSMEQWMKKSQFSGRTPDGRPSNLGRHQRYPSAGSIIKVWPTMRDAWREAGFEVDSGYMEWSPMEDWFVMESAGVLPRTEVAAAIGRTVPAVKRRLYDLGGFVARKRWGLSLTAAASMLNISSAIFSKYIRSGAIPVFRGYKVIYINPADLMSVKEFDWTEPDNIDPELADLVRRSLIQRACKIIKFGSNWRDHEIYKFEKDSNYLQGRIKKTRQPIMPDELPERPNVLQVGDWVTMKASEFGVAGRLGRIRNVYYSSQICDRRDGTHRACWIALVEFPRLRHSAHSSEERIRYSLPLDLFEPVAAPEIKAKPLSMKPEAIRGRKRFGEALVRGRKRFSEIREQLT